MYFQLVRSGCNNILIGYSFPLKLIACIYRLALKMIKKKPLFERLLSESQHQSLSGWDFSYLADRWITEKTSWDYAQIVQEKMKQAGSLLDMGTGGGELLYSFAPLPETTFATEEYTPNVPIARYRLEPLDVKVVETHSNDNLGFEDNFFELIINRHSSFSAGEVYRILKPKGYFITQQVGNTDNVRLNELLQKKVKLSYYNWTLEYAVQQIIENGFKVLVQKEAFPETIVRDVGALIYYLKVIPWQIPDFSIAKYYDRLIAIHNHIQDQGSLTIRSHRFFIEALK
jgi:SAM-dependent methyltransferase